MRTEFGIKALCIGWLRGGWSLTWPVRCLMGPVWSRYSSFSLCSTFFRFVYSCYDYWKWKLFVAHIIIFLTYGHRTALRTRYVWFPVNISYLVLHINMLERTACPLCRYLVNRKKFECRTVPCTVRLGTAMGFLFRCATFWLSFRHRWFVLLHDVFQTPTLLSVKLYYYSIVAGEVWNGNRIDLFFYHRCSLVAVLYLSCCFC